MAKPLPVERSVGTSVANAAQTVSSPARGRRVLKLVTVAYDTAVSLDVTVTLNAGAGPTFDVTLATITLGAQRFGTFIPDIPLPLSDGDAIDVVAPAGGVGIISTVQTYMEPE